MLKVTISRTNQQIQVQIRSYNQNNVVCLSRPASSSISCDLAIREMLVDPRMILLINMTVRMITMQNFHVGF